MQEATTRTSALDAVYDEGDNLTHTFCKACFDKAVNRGWKLMALCGATGKARGDGTKPYNPAEDCKVCDDLVAIPCQQCGRSVGKRNGR